MFLAREDADTLPCPVIQAVAVVSDYPPNLGVKILKGKTTHTLIAGHREIKMKLKWVLLPCWLVFIILQAAVQAAGEKGNR